MAVLTLDQMKKEGIWNQIKAILHKNGVNLSPKITMTPAGMAFEIDLVEVPKQAPGIGADGFKERGQGGYNE